MTFEEVENNIEGSILKGQYLEAFLLQSSYIEGLLKNFADFSTWKAIRMERKLDDNSKKITDFLMEDVSKYGFRKLIDYIHDANFLSKEDRNKLHAYREIRNKVVHSLATKISQEDFNLELKEACKKGQVIMNTDIIAEVSRLNKEYSSNKNTKSPDTKREGGN